MSTKLTKSYDLTDDEVRLLTAIRDCRLTVVPVTPAGYRKAHSKPFPGKPWRVRLLWYTDHATAHPKNLKLFARRIFYAFRKQASTMGLQEQWEGCFVCPQERLPELKKLPVFKQIREFNKEAASANQRLVLVTFADPREDVRMTHVLWDQLKENVAEWHAEQAGREEAERAKRTKRKSRK